MSTIIYINHRTKGRIPVAEVRGDVLHKSIYDASWLMQKPPGIAFDSSSLADAEQAGAEYICAVYAGMEYWCALALIRKRGIPVSRGHGLQRGLGWDDWKANRTLAAQHAKTRLAKPVGKTPVVSQQELGI